MDYMAKKMLIDATHAEQTRVVVVDGKKVEEFDFESQSRRQLAGNIYLAKVTRVEPSLQAAFIDYGGNRHGFLAFSEIHPDYYQIPVADREALMAEEKAYAEAMAAEADAAEEERQKPKKSRRRRRGGSKAAAVQNDDAVATKEVEAVDGMETIDLGEDDETTNTSVEDVAAGDLPSPDESDAQPQPEEAEPAAEADSNEATDADAAEAASEEQTDNEAADEDDTAEAPTDTGIESVAQEDDSEDVRPVRKPRPRRYKIQEVVKVRQILLVQVVKEERGNKGAALTTYLSLAGRYCVLMPNTARGGGISRKITNAADRKKLKEIAQGIEVPDGAGLIVRTAGAKRTKTEIKRDYEYLLRMWEQIRELTLQSTAPAMIYEEGDLIKRSIRDLYNRDIDEVLVEGDAGYRNAKDTMKMIMPSHAKNVKHYSDGKPLFARYQVESFLDGMFNPTVQLKSGGYLVIGITEALVAIDVNSGRATKEGSIEQTALTTNLEAAAEVARQLRLRDLAGLIVIDFIDMEERRNNSAVEKMLKEKLKTDRARIQVGRISGFGLMEMSRQRLRPGMLEATTQPCAHCHGTGLIRSEDSLGLSILREIEEEGGRRRSKEVLVKAPISIANFLINQKREAIAQIEQSHGMSVRIEADPFKISPDYEIEKFKSATRFVPEPTAVVSSVDISLMEEVDEDTPEEEVIVQEEEQPKRKRRRRRRRRGGGGQTDANNDANNTENTGNDQSGGDGVVQTEAATTTDGDGQSTDAAADAAPEEAPKRKRTRRSRKRSDATEAPAADNADSEAPIGSEDKAVASDAEEKPKRRRSTKKAKSDEPATAEVGADAVAEKPSEPEAVEEAPKPKRKYTRRKKSDEAETGEPAAEEKPKAKRTRKKKSDDEDKGAEPEAKTATEPAPKADPAPTPAAESAAAPDDGPAKPKRRGWWSRG